jgi:hypothetical protein
MTVQIPNFATIDQLPSWCNLRGAIDRSACVEIRVSELRRLAECVTIDRSQRDSRRRLLHITAPLPDERPAPLRLINANGRRICTGVFTVTAAMLHDLHQSRMPRTLAGDFRTARANVMRNHGSDQQSALSDQIQSKTQNPKSKIRFRLRIKRNAVAFPIDIGLDGNPNKGAARTKRIGLEADWSQPIRIEKWVYPKRIRPAYFMICPNSIRHREHREHRVGKNSELNLSSVSSVNSVVQLPPPLSTRPPSRLDPFSSGGRCPQRCLKLLMVQCTPHEAADAEAAQLWIDSLPDKLRLREPYRSHINRLIARYGPIFHPRMLLCPRCCGGRGGVRYGNNPETVRQSWRRRNNKPDTTCRGHIGQTVRDNQELSRLLDMPAAELEQPQNLEPLCALTLKVMSQRIPGLAAELGGRKLRKKRFRSKTSKP